MIPDFDSMCRESFPVIQILKNRLNFNLGIITTVFCSPPLTSAFSMSDDNSPPEDNVSRVNPLKLAKRKKPCVYRPSMQMNGFITDFCSVVQEIPSFTTDDILVERYTLCAVSMPCLRALLRVWGKMRTSQKSYLHSSSCNSLSPFHLMVNASLPNTGPGRSTGFIKSSRNWYLVSLNVSWRRLKRTSW
jgi:hypothetical protein